MSVHDTRMVHAACPHDCPDTCAMEITVEQGRAVKVRGSDAMPFTHGALCTKVSHYLERVYSEKRLQYPMRRVGRKGEGRFERISWDEALDIIARSLHPLLTRFLLKQFHQPEGTNGAQLIFTTHDTTLLDSDLLRRDQIWFVEKPRKEQSTQLYPLLDFRPRKDEALERGYLMGRYGALPFVGDLRI